MRGGDTCWWDDSWNPLSGCRPTGPGCRNCYAVKQFGVIQQQHGPQRTVVPLYDGILANGHFTGRANVLPPWDDGWNWPLDWPGAESPRMGAGKPSLIFVVDMGDLFYEGHPTSRIDQVVGTIVLSAHIGLLLTRRPHRMAEYFADRSDDITLRLWQPKLWLGFSAERQREFDLAWEPIERVRVRRRERGDARPFDPTGLAERHARIARLRTQVEQRGVRALTVSSENAVATIIELLRQSERSDCATFELPPATAPRRGNGRDDVEPRVEVFGHTLFRSQDLDPVYLAAPQAVRDGQLHRWLVSYCLFYHCGAACFLSEQEDFWRALMIAAKNETPTPFGGRWPRGAERRHFRGGAAVKAVAVLQQRYS